MKDIIAKLDKIAAQLEDIDNAYAFNLTWQLDKITQDLSDRYNKLEKFAKLGSLIDDKRSVLSEYINNVLFLCENESKLKGLIKKQSSKDVENIYRTLKRHFSKLGREDSICFIKKILKDSK